MPISQNPGKAHSTNIVELTGLRSQNSIAQSDQCSLKERLVEGVQYLVCVIAQTAEQPCSASPLYTARERLSCFQASLPVPPQQYVSQTYKVCQAA